MADVSDAVEALDRQLAAVSVMDDLRESRRLTMPSSHMCFKFDQLSMKIMKSQRKTCNGQCRKQTSFFGAPAILQAKLWEMIKHHGTCHPKFQPKHLLWTLCFMRNHPNESVMAGTMKTKDEKKAPDEKTLRKWIGEGAKALAGLKEHVIVFENRHTNDRGNDCLPGVDCTDCPFQQILIPHPTKPDVMTINKSLCSKKMNGPALRCEIGSCLLSNDIVWVAGPCLPGDWNDATVFRQGLIHELDEFERVEADDGCIGESPGKVVCPKGLAMMGKKELIDHRKRAQGRIESINGHLKSWRCLSARHHGKGDSNERIEKHRRLFLACLSTKQMGMELGIDELCKLGDDCE